MEKHLKVLGLDPRKQHTVEEIKAAWRKKVKETHPDQGGTDEAFRAVMHAYNMITDPSYRTEDQMRESQARMDLDIRMQVPISFEQAFTGCSFHANYNRTVMGDDGKLIPQDPYEIESLHIAVPRGSMSGVQMHFKQKGIKRGEQMGDVEVHVMVQPHPKFRADDDGNIIAVEKVPLDILLRGGKFDVQTMIGIRTVKLKPGTRPGERLTIKGCGANQADHYIICEPLYPTQDDLKKEAWKGLDVNWAINEEVNAENEEEMGWQKQFRSRGGIVFSNGIQENICNTQLNTMFMVHTE